MVCRRKLAKASVLENKIDPKMRIPNAKPDNIDFLCLALFNLFLPGDLVPPSRAFDMSALRIWYSLFLFLTLKFFKVASDCKSYN